MFGGKTRSFFWSQMFGRPGFGVMCSWPLFLATFAQRTCSGPVMDQFDFALSGMKGHPNSGGLFKAASRELARVVSDLEERWLKSGKGSRTIFKYFVYIGDRFLGFARALLVG